MATLNVIRRWALREQMSIREISSRTGLARNTVKKYLRSDETEPSYTRRGSPSKLGPYAEKLVNWLEVEATKSRKGQRNLKLMEILGEAPAQLHTWRSSPRGSLHKWVRFRRNSTAGSIDARRGFLMATRRPSSREPCWIAWLGRSPAAIF
jgi:transcriptional regulator with XRE-family HTH domain